jgi:DNA-binding response OmpR family regulator
MKTVLIVDDDTRIAAALEIRFKAGGYSTTTAGDAVTGLGYALEQQPSLIILDLALPGGDGLELARKLRCFPATRAIPFILLTASQDPHLRGRAMELRAAGLFDKPYDAEELMAVAAHALGETSRFHRQSDSQAGALATPSVPATPKKVVIVEDDDRIATALAVRLNSAGYETLVAGDALSGMRTVVNSNPDLVLLDISMPAGNGFTMAERIRTVLPNPVPVIFLTASKQPEFRARARQLGAAGYFEKPYEAADLLAAVRRQIGG